MNLCPFNSVQDCPYEYSAMLLRKDLLPAPQALTAVGWHLAQRTSKDVFTHYTQSSPLLEVRESSGREPEKKCAVIRHENFIWSTLDSRMATEAGKGAAKQLLSGKTSISYMKVQQRLLPDIETSYSEY